MIYMTQTDRQGDEIFRRTSGTRTSAMAMASSSFLSSSFFDQVAISGRIQKERRDGEGYPHIHPTPRKLKSKKQKKQKAKSKSAKSKRAKKQKSKKKEVLAWLKPTFGKFPKCPFYLSIYLTISIIYLSI